MRYFKRLAGIKGKPFCYYKYRKKLNNREEINSIYKVIVVIISPDLVLSVITDA